MSLNSVNTNQGALIALQNLNATNQELNSVQTRINTGLKVGSAKDNGAIWAIAQNQRATSLSLNAVKDSLQRSQSTIDVAVAGGESVSDLLVQMKEKALAASESTLDTASRKALNDDFVALRDQIAKAVSNAEFNGTNLIKNGGSAVGALANASGSSTITIAAQDLSLGGGNVTVGATSSIGTASAASAMLTTIQTSIDNVSSALAKLGTGSKAIQSHLTFIGKLQDTIDAGVGNLVDADLAKESARLQALQTKQQLGIQALSIANASTSSLLWHCVARANRSTHSTADSRAIRAFNAGIRRPAALISSSPSPISNGRSRTSPAISPQSPTQRPCVRISSTICFRNRRKPGCVTLASGATRVLPRSAAKKYWQRSFVPMLKKSTSRHSRSSTNETAGTSSMIPIGMSRSNGTPRVARSSWTWAICALTQSTSSIDDTMGRSSSMGPRAEARTMARNCVRINCWCST